MPQAGEPPPVVISELEPLPTQLASKDPILFNQVGQGTSLLAIQPAGEDGEHHVESRRVDHRGSLQHAAKIGCSDRVGRVVGQYGRLHDPNLRLGQPFAH
jgi:hypothetical protein